MTTIDTIKTSSNKRLSIKGIIRTMYDPRSKLTSEVNGQLFNYFGDAVYRTVVPRNIRLAEAQVGWLTRELIRSSLFLKWLLK